MFNQGVITFGGGGGGAGGGGGGITSINSATGPSITFAGREGIYVNRVSNTIYVGQDLASSGFATYDSLYTSGYIRNVDFVSSGYATYDSLYTSGYIRNEDFASSGFLKTDNVLAGSGVDSIVTVGNDIYINTSGAGGGGDTINNYFNSSGVANRAEWFLAEYNHDLTQFDHGYFLRQPLNIVDVVLYGNSPSGTTTLGVASGWPGESPTSMYSVNSEPNISGINQVSSGLLPDNVAIPQGAILYVDQTTIDATASGLRFSIIFNNSINSTGSGITTINGEDGPTVSIVGGHGTQVTTSTDQVKIEVSGGASAPLHSVDYNISGPLATVSGFDNGQFFTKPARIIDVVAYGDSPNGDVTLSLSKGYSGVAPTPLYTSATKPIINGTKAVTSGFLPDVTDIGAEEILFANVEGVAANASGVRLVVYYENIDESIFVMGGVANRAIETKTTHYTLDSGDNVILVDATSQETTITVPSASGANQEGKVYDIKKIDSSINGVIVSGVENIDDAASQTLAAQYESLTIISNGTQWWII